VTSLLRLGVQVEQDGGNGTIKLHQLKYLEQVLRTFDWKNGHRGKISQTSMLPNQRMTESDYSLIPVPGTSVMHP
jgi:hypothetical protein